jgi:tripartite-type tricarboxylate transporter receptor subunit TctC
MNHIPYKGNAPAIADLIGGQVSLIFDNLASVLPHTRSGKLRALAVTSDQRSPLLPDLPTVAETPGLAGFEVSGWHGLFAPAGTSPEIVHQLSKEVARILRTPEMQQQLSGQGVEPVGSTPEEFAAFQRRETEKWAQAVKISGAKVE